MPIQFTPDLVPLKTQKPADTRNNNSTAQTQSSTEISSATAGLKTSNSKVYTLSGDTRFSIGDRGSLLDAYRQSRHQVEAQLSALMKNHATKSGATAKGLADIADFEGPKGETYADLAEYWNKGNTAQRIFTIAMMGYEEDMDRAEFAERAKSIVKQAYGDVGMMIGGNFPQLVQDTRQAVIDAIDQFASGTEMSEVTY